MGEYPDNWDEIAKEIKDQAEWCCEHCHHPHDPSTGHTLTVHHLDGNKSHCDYVNLVALCQRCHLRIQARYFPGQTFLFEAPQWAIKRNLAQEKQETRSNQNANE